MNDRLVTLLGAGVALLIFLFLFFPPQPAPLLSRPTSVEAGPSGYLGLHNWLAKENVEIRSITRRFDTWIETEAIPTKGNILITTLPHLKPFRADERTALELWLKKGNTVLVMAALDDTPKWSLIGDPEMFLEDFEALTGLRVSAYENSAGEPVHVDASLKDEYVDFLPVGPHPLMEGVEQLRGVTGAETAIWQLDLEPEDPFIAQLALEQQSRTGAVWEIPVEDGVMLVSASSSLFGNRVLGQSDNARFLINILRYHLQPGGFVLFDDMHQGITDIYDAEAFYSDPRLHNSLLFILGFWLLYLLGTSKRLAPPITLQHRPQQSDLVAAMSAFMSRKLTPVSIGKLMVDHFLQELHQRGLIKVNDTVWEQLESLPLARKEPLHQVRKAYAELGRGTKVDLKKLHNHIYQLRRILE